MTDSTRIVPGSRSNIARNLRDQAIRERRPRQADFLVDLADLLEGKAITQSELLGVTKVPIVPDYTTYISKPDTTPLDQIETAPARNTDPATSHLSAIRNFTTGRGKLLKAFGDSRFPMPAERATRMAGINGTASPWKRVSELKKAGIIEPTGRQATSTRGAKVTEYQLTEFGRSEYARIIEATDA